VVVVVVVVVRCTVCGLTWFTRWHIRLAAAQEESEKWRSESHGERDHVEELTTSMRHADIEAYTAAPFRAAH